MSYQNNENILDRLNKRHQRLMNPQAAGMSGVVWNDSDSESKEDLTIFAQITCKDIRSRLKLVTSPYHYGKIKYIKNWIKDKASKKKAVWPHDVMRYLRDSLGITSITEPIYYFDLVEKIFLLVFSLIEEIPLNRFLPPGAKSEWIHRLSAEDRVVVADYHQRRQERGLNRYENDNNTRRGRSNNDLGLETRRSTGTATTSERRQSGLPDIPRRQPCFQSPFPYIPRRQPCFQSHFPRMQSDNSRRHFTRVDHTSRSERFTTNERRQSGLPDIPRRQPCFRSQFSRMQSDNSRRHFTRVDHPSRCERDTTSERRQSGLPKSSTSVSNGWNASNNSKPVPSGGWNLPKSSVSQKSSTSVSNGWNVSNNSKSVPSGGWNLPNSSVSQKSSTSKSVPSGGWNLPNSSVSQKSSTSVSNGWNVSNNPELGWGTRPSLQSGSPDINKRGPSTEQAVQEKVVTEITKNAVPSGGWNLPKSSVSQKSSTSVSNGWNVSNNSKSVPSGGWNLQNSSVSQKSSTSVSNGWNVSNNPELGWGTRPSLQSDSPDINKRGPATEHAVQEKVVTEITKNASSTEASESTEVIELDVPEALEKTSSEENSVPSSTSKERASTAAGLESSEPDELEKTMEKSTLSESQIDGKRSGSQNDGKKSGSPDVDPDEAFHAWFNSPEFKQMYEEADQNEESIITGHPNANAKTINCFSDVEERNRLWEKYPHLRPKSPKNELRRSKRKRRPNPQYNGNDDTAQETLKKKIKKFSSEKEKKNLSE